VSEFQFCICGEVYAGVTVWASLSFSSILFLFSFFFSPILSSFFFYFPFLSPDAPSPSLSFCYVLFQGRLYSGNWWTVPLMTFRLVI
jgi:hypothetical protein